MTHFLDFSPSPKIFLDVQSPIILYTDASDVPERVPRHVLGAVLLDNDSMWHTSWPVPAAIIEKWIPKKNHMSQLEILAAPLALQTWKDKLLRRDVILFIDNEGACSNLVKGYSPHADRLFSHRWPILADGLFFGAQRLRWPGWIQKQPEWWS